MFDKFLDAVSQEGTPQRRLFKYGIAAAAVGAVVLIGWWIGSTNVVTPAGYVGYITRDAVFGKTTFYGLQIGPTSTGMGWMLRGKNISVTPFNFERDFSLEDGPLSLDGMRVKFHVGVAWRIRASQTKEFVEKYSTIVGGERLGGDIEKAAFNEFVAQRLLTFVLEQIHKRRYAEISDQIGLITDTLKTEGAKYCESTPFEILTANVNNVQFPEVVSNAAAAKIAREQELQQMDSRLQIAQKNAQIKVAEANGIAEAQRIIAGTLTPPYLTHEAIQNQEKVIDSKTTTVIYIPVGANGIPLVNNIGQR
jgi:regulator of protease activity HflC (stomatin/prohibitin superfamily)